MNNEISLVMIVKNEAKVLRNCLESVKHCVDEIVVVDTGSTDDTAAVAKEYSDKVFFYPWNEDFSAARNYAIEQVAGQWILSLDADEELICRPDALRELARRDDGTEAYMIPIDYPINQASGEYNRFLILRFFKNLPELRFIGKIHEQVVVTRGSTVNLAQDVYIKHMEIPASERRRKRNRNIVLLQRALRLEPDNVFLKYYLGLDWLGLGKPAKALPFLREAYNRLTDEHLLFKSAALRYFLLSLFYQGEYHQVICLCQEAAQKYPEYTDVFYICGSALEEIKEYKAAVKWFQQALKCGSPPPLYSHQQGTGSFLTNYHLGHCYSLLGRRADAAYCLEKALEQNTTYIYPVYSLFLLLLADLGANGTVSYLEKREYLSDFCLARLFCELFIKAGHPEAALRSLANCRVEPDYIEEYLYLMGQSSIFSGNLHQGLSYLEQVKPAGPYKNAQIYRVFGLLMCGKREEARSLALQMWKRGSREEARALLSVIRCLNSNISVKTGSTADLGEIYLKLLDICLSYLPDINTDFHHRTLVGFLEENLKTNPRDIKMLQDYYAARERDVREFVNYKYGSGWDK